MTTALAIPSLNPKKRTSKSTIKVKATAYQSVNPYNGQLLETFEELTAAQLEKAIKTAATCFESWRHTTFAERAAIVTKAATLMRERADEFAKPVTLDLKQASGDWERAGLGFFGGAGVFRL